MEISAMLDSENIQDYQGSDTDSYDSPVVQFIQDVQIEPQPTNLIIRYQPPLIEQQLLKTFKRLPQNCFDRILNKQ
ncbi:hypothetical protein SS50377_22465 [Spironucleus salmonicida]|uniref:Uncharacterized protein n=1 Tax=Spironucleus salmonicida TaxID=348837 RepID=V6LMV0_9EUKA|nr:hypothetical protein SS50377_22465 [Spironucleus salmonicida]|eukprot:EST42044.1 Hypothetical protein SS50377_18351 [Spironucleus salmonicida]